jgi:hypothetical protein
MLEEERIRLVEQRVDRAIELVDAALDLDAKNRAVTDAQTEVIQSLRRRMDALEEWLRAYIALVERSQVQ